ncbi:MAG: penicillin-binding protein 1A [Rickettsiales bacterium]
MSFKKRHPLLHGLISGLAAGFGLATGIAVVGTFAVFAVIHHYSQDLPDLTRLSQYRPAITTRLYTEDGDMFASYAVQRRNYVPLEDIPKKVRQAFIAAEDKNFYTHTGIDAGGIGRAILNNVQHYGARHSLVGGSTITQQVVKNLLLTKEKSLTRKIKEAILAFRITREFSKDRILELYLNDIYLGMGAYGVAAAGEEYFGKELRELKTEEIALLAAMPKAPAYYDPRKNYDAALGRRNYVINRMLEDGYLNQAEADNAKLAKIETVEQDVPTVTDAPYFAEEIRRTLAEQYGNDTLYKGGLYVMTTLDLELQNYADNALRQALEDYDRRHGYRGPIVSFENVDAWQDKLKEVLKKKTVPLVENHQLAVVLNVANDKADLGLIDGSDAVLPFTGAKWAQPVSKEGTFGKVPQKMQDVVKKGDVIVVRYDPEEKVYGLAQIPAINGALVAMDPHTGRVLAMSGGYSFDKTVFNRATQARRQPGSSFKPFVYLSALERGFAPNSIVMDSPIEISQGPGLPLWRPKNFNDEYLGAATLRTGIEKSRNVMTVRLAQAIGIDTILSTAHRFGLYENAPHHLSIVLGSQEVTPLQMTTAYAMIANGGLRVQPSLVERIDDGQGKTIYRFDQRPCSNCVMDDIERAQGAYPVVSEPRERVLDPRVDYQMISILQGVVQRGTAVAAKKLGVPLAGKTGTTNESRDTWFMGFSSDLVVGVFIGFDQPKSMGRKETGGRVALPAFISFMEKALKKYPAHEFAVPEGIQFATINAHTGDQSLPWLQVGGPTIQEAFVTGGSIYIPGETPEITDEATYQEAPSETETGAVTQPQQMPVSAYPNVSEDTFMHPSQVQQSAPPRETAVPMVPMNSDQMPAQQKRDLGPAPAAGTATPAGTGTGGIY